MKNLSVNTVARVTGSKIVVGSESLVISSAAAVARYLGRGGLLFEDFPKGGLPEECLPFAVVTARSEYFAGMKDITILKTENVEKAYWSFVAYYRSLFRIPVIGVTGTCGKTTTKEMIRHILSEKYRVTATYKSYNAQFRHFGYLMEIDETTQAGVYEMGVAAPGDLKICCRYFKPQIGVITNIGVDHIQAFGSLDAYIRAKAEFLEELGDQGILILNADDENIRKIDFGGYHGRVVSFGTGAGSDFRITRFRQQKNYVEFALRFRNSVFPFRVPGYGEFTACNASAAAAAAYAAGIAPEKAARRMETFQSVERHFELKEGIGGSTVIDDTWSTNPTSAVAAVKLMKSISQGRKTVAVLGKMSLLGVQSGEYHRRTGEQIAQIGIDRLILLGDGAAEIGKGALNGGMDPENVIFCGSIGQAAGILRRLLDRETIALIKTSMLGSYKTLTDAVTAES